MTALRSIAMLMARRTRTSLSGLRALLMASTVLAREPVMRVCRRGLALNCDAPRGATRGKASTSPASTAATWAAGSLMKRKVARLIRMALALRKPGQALRVMDEPLAQLSSS